MARRTLAAAAAAAMTASLAVVAVAPAGAADEPDATVVPIQITGEPEDRLNLIILGDGYTAEEMPKFREEVDKHLNVQWSLEPFRSYRNYFNVYMVEVASNESGISCDPDDGNVRRDTAFSLQYASTCPADPNARGVTFGSGGRQALEAAIADIPGVTEANRQTLTLANTSTYGGIGGRNATTTGSNALGPLVSPHELGHSLGGLQDEYPYSQRGVPGRPYTGGEPNSAHHTIMTTEEMIENEAKWWRWLGEESVSGGIIDRYESGMTRSSGVWRPTRHSMMRSVGYYFDEVSREVMTEKISGRRDLGQMAITTTPGTELGPEDVAWVETPHPMYHELDVTWEINGEELDTANSRNLDLRELDVSAGDEVTVTVQDPTEFVRDPAIRESGSLTATDSWVIGEPVSNGDVVAEFTTSTQTDRPVGGEDVVYVETTHPAQHVLDVAWELEGEELPNPNNSRNLDLGALELDEGTYELTATVTDPTDPADSDELTWTVDNVPPQVDATFSEPLRTVEGRHNQPDRNIYQDWFTMDLQPTDDQEGYVVGEFRLDGDGWHNYYGWPDAPEGTPYLFTPTGTNIKEIIYGALSPGGLTWASFEEREPGYGSHTVEYRAIDAAGNISEPQQLDVRVTAGGGGTPPGY